MRGAQKIPSGPEDLTPEYLTDALRAGGGISDDPTVSSFDVEPIGEGAGFLGLVIRLRMRYAGDDADAPRTLIAKFPSPVEGSRTIAKLYGAYEREVRFYAEIAGEVGLCAPRCYHSALDVEADRYLLLLEDLEASGRIGDQVRGCTEEEAMLAIDELARFHAAWWNSPRLEQIAWLPLGTDLVRAMPALYPQAKPVFMELYGDRLTGDIAGVMEGLAGRVLEMLPDLDARPPTLVHADYRLDNMFFGDEGSRYRLALVDWQAPNRSFAAYDLGYFISGSVLPELRRARERLMIERYHAGLLEHGVRDYSLELLADDYRRALLVALAIEAVSAATLERSSARAVQLWEVMFDRLVDAIADSDALALLPGSP